ncbi:MAG: transposase, partial [Acidobacteria bacterium]|nr:transposase [Acidobacteriota bacterium]
MQKKAQAKTARRFTPRATLAALGIKLRSMKLLEPIQRNVEIPQKTIRHSPLQKLTDAFVAILAGARGLVEINTRVRSDSALQRAFGRAGCAEQSVVQETLNACTPQTVTQMERAVDEIFRHHSSAYKHNYSESLQILDVDLSGMPCGPKAALAYKGYFAKDSIRTGRQLGRVAATLYEEVVVDRLFPGNAKLTEALQPLVLATEETLALDESRRKRTLLRIDAGGGSLGDVNWCLGRGYQIHCKDFSSARAEALAATVKQWYEDPHHEGRQLGWVTAEPLDYVRPVRRLALRWRLKNGQTRYGALISTLAPREVVNLVGLPVDRVNDPHAVVLAYAKFYDQRGGGVETEFKQDKQGVGITKRNKKRFPA